jgi:hypothetical protein
MNFFLLKAALSKQTKPLHGPNFVFLRHLTLCQVLTNCIWRYERIPIARFIVAKFRQLTDDAFADLWVTSTPAFWTRLRLRFVNTSTSRLVA